MKQKSISLKMEVKACHNIEISVVWAMLLFVVIVAPSYVVGGRRRM